MTFLLRVLVILKIRAVVTQLVIVKVLDLTAFQWRFNPKFLSSTDFINRRQRMDELFIHFLFRYGIAFSDKRRVGAAPKLLTSP